MWSMFLSSQQSPLRPAVAMAGWILLCMIARTASTAPPPAPPAEPLQGVVPGREEGFSPTVEPTMTGEPVPTLPFSAAETFPEPPVEMAAELKKQLRRMESNQFSERQAAQKELASLAAQFPETLASLYPDVDAESRARLLQLLETVLLSCADERGDRAERSLQRLSESGVSAAEAILIGNLRLREGRARLAIEALGGELLYSSPLEYPTPTASVVGVGFGSPAVLKTILIPEDWKGTTKDLWHLSRLSFHQNLVLYNIKGSSISLDELQPLMKTFSGIRIEERGACLGIHASPGAEKASIHEIMKGGAAEAANLKKNDEILRVNDSTVRNFAHLVELLRTYSPGDVVRMQIKRDGEEMEVPVKLASWKKILAREIRSISPPPVFAGPLGFALPPPAVPPETDAPEQPRPLENN